LQHSIRQINISLHDAEENIVKDKWDDYLQTALEFALEAAPKSYVSLRLWNTSNTESAEFNALCLTKISDEFNLSLPQLDERANGNGLKLSEHIFFNRAPRFEWPEENGKPTQTKKTCYALRDHIAILADGQVVPCCLDANANLFLGNIFSENLSEILQKERAVNIKKGFEQHKIVEPLCATCGFIVG
jgi:radical SAM protein with 4Fe4S-binding SPASM domain